MLHSFQRRALGQPNAKLMNMVPTSLTLSAESRFHCRRRKSLRDGLCYRLRGYC